LLCISASRFSDRLGSIQPSVWVTFKSSLEDPKALKGAFRGGNSDWDALSQRIMAAEGWFGFALNEVSSTKNEGFIPNGKYLYELQR